VVEADSPAMWSCPGSKGQNSAIKVGDNRGTNFCMSFPYSAW